MLIVNTGSVLLILWQDSANIIYQTHRPAVLWPNKPGMFIVDIYNNCIKLSAVSGCLLILSASVITEEPCVPLYLVLSFASCFRLCIHSFIHCEPCVCFSNEVSRRLCDYLFE